MGLIQTCGLCHSEMKFGDFSHKKAGLVVCQHCFDTKDDRAAKQFLQSVVTTDKNKGKSVH